MTWNYRLCKKKYKTDLHEEIIYEIHEVYYNADGGITAVTEDAVRVLGEDISEIETCLLWMKLALKKDIIDLDILVFADDSNDEDTI